MNSTINRPLVKDVIAQITNLLYKKLENLEVSPERAAKIASFVLKTLPPDTSDNAVRNIIPSLDDEFIELAGFVNQFLSSDETKMKEDIANNAEDFIRRGRLEEARKLMQVYLKRKIG